MIISQYLTIIWINHDSGTNSTALSFTKWESLPFSPRSGGRTRRSAPTSAANGAAAGTPTGTVARRPMGRRWRRWAPYGTCAWTCSWYHGGIVVPSQVVVFLGFAKWKATMVWKGWSNLMWHLNDSLLSLLWHYCEITRVDRVDMWI